jgi:hypothetical protein
MTTSPLRTLTGRPVNKERRLRSGVALLYVLGLAIFFVWFIATHLTRYRG